jgi:hypothetical protein
VVGRLLVPANPRNAAIQDSRSETIVSFVAALAENGFAAWPEYTLVLGTANDGGRLTEPKSSRAIGPRRSCSLGKQSARLATAHAEFCCDDTLPG